MYRARRVERESYQHTSIDWFRLYVPLDLKRLFLIRSSQPISWRGIEETEMLAEPLQNTHTHKMNMHFLLRNAVYVDYLYL